LPVPLIPTVALEASALKEGVFMECVPVASSLAMRMIADQCTTLLTRIELLETRAVLTRIVGQAISVLNPVEVFTELVLDNIC